MPVYNVTKLDKELQEALIPIHGVSSDGTISFKAEATAPQITQGEAIKLAHDPTDTEGIALATAKTKVEAIKSNANSLYNWADPFYAGLSGADKTLHLTTISTGWAAATTAAKADALRVAIALLTISVWYLYLKSR